MKMMTKILASSAVMVAVLAISGCSESPKSIEEYQKLSKEELDSMFKECSEKIEASLRYPQDKIKSEADFKAGVEFERKAAAEMKELMDRIEQVLGRSDSWMGYTFGWGGVGYGWFGQITDDELKKIGSSRLSELVQCGRIAIAREGGAENYTKNRSVAEKYKNLLK